MQEWISLKESIAVWTGLDSDGLHILASLLLFILAAILWRKPMSNIRPWLTVLVLEFVNETVTGFADGILEKSEVSGSLPDIFVVMAVPTVLMLLGHYFPKLISAPPDRRILVPGAWDPPRRIVDAEFEEVEGPAAQPRRQRQRRA